MVEPKKELSPSLVARIFSALIILGLGLIVWMGFLIDRELGLLLAGASLIALGKGWL